MTVTIGINQGKGQRNTIMDEEVYLHTEDAQLKVIANMNVKITL